jgi:hypothetical protein
MQVAQLCDSCGFALWKHECLKCGNTISRGGIVAELCASCSRKAGDKCIKCHRQVSGPGVTALLCGGCAFQAVGKKCVACGKYLEQAAAASA